MLSGLPLVIQAAFLDGQFFDFSPSLDNGLIPAEVDVGGGEVGDAFVVAVVVVALDERADGGLEVARQIVVLQQNAALQGLMPALDFALGLRMVWCTADVIHALTLEPDGKIAGDVGRAVVPMPAGRA